MKDYSNDEETSGSEATASDRTSVLQEKAQNVVKKLFLNADIPPNNKDGKKIAAMCYRDLQKSKSSSKVKKNSIMYDSESWNSDSPSDNSETSQSNSSESSSLPNKSGKKYAIQTECIQAGKKRKQDKRRQKRRKKIKSWLEESCKSRPRTKASSNRIYARKHRAGLYLSQERSMSMIAYQNFKFLYYALCIRESFSWMGNTSINQTS